MNAHYWKVFYKIQEVLIGEFEEQYPLFSGKVNKQLNDDVIKITDAIFALQDDKIENINYTIVISTSEIYHSYLNELESDLRAFIGEIVVADHYFLAIDLEKEEVLGGFAFSDNGELQGLFSLVRGKWLGEEFFDKQVTIATKHLKGKIKWLTLNCLGLRLHGFYSASGFKRDNVARWDERLAPKEWNTKRFGMPNLFYMSKEI